MNKSQITSASTVDILGIHPIPQISRKDQEKIVESEEELPTFRQSDTLPQLLKEGVGKFRTEEEKTLFLLSTLTVCSGLFTNMYGT